MKAILRWARSHVRAAAFAFLGALTFSVPLRASLDPSLALSQYVHSHWQTQSGLPQNSVSSIAQTSDGYLWVGTEDGLARFDGLKFTIYDSQTVSAFRSNSVMILRVDPDGVLWIGTRGGGLLIYKNGEFLPVSSPGLDQASVTALIEDRSGDMWIATDGNGLFRRHHSSFQRISEQDGMPDSTIFAMTTDQAGRLWVGTRNGISHRVGERFVREPALSKFDRTQVRSLLWNRDGSLWFAPTGQGLFRLTGSSVTRFSSAQGLSSPFVSCIYQVKATEAKLLDFLRKSPQFIIPIYQRTYSWTDKECRQLWDDIIRTGSDDKVSVHFIGSIVYIEKGLSDARSRFRS